MKLCSIDLDGVLNYYPKPWLEFLKARGHDFKSVREAKGDLSYAEYYELKGLYRKSARKRYQAPRHGAVEFTQELSNGGYKIIVTTTRPVRRYPHLITWTIKWLLENGFQFDDVLFTRDRPLFLFERYPDVEFIVEDDPEKADFLRKFCDNIFILSGDDEFQKILEEIG